MKPANQCPESDQPTAGLPKLCLVTVQCDISHGIWHVMNQPNPKGVENLRILYAELGAAVLRARQALGPGPGAMDDAPEFLAADREVVRLTRLIAAIQDSEVRSKSA